ncbi:uncharacterized protein DFL_000714 [Arthrobotrys flagrans]|uniref:Uncharacterized protein n=1 Tax=Arthrobotrys flagrans TaxID=97331 RepID=A0A437AEI3_ARTFL|nr:hypothetical protein DFL_000714 [Arthrobotrys flagrans]
MDIDHRHRLLETCQYGQCTPLSPCAECQGGLPNYHPGYPNATGAPAGPQHLDNPRLFRGVAQNFLAQTPNLYFGPQFGPLDDPDNNGGGAKFDAPANIQYANAGAGWTQAVNLLIPNAPDVNDNIPAVVPAPQLIDVGYGGGWAGTFPDQPQHFFHNQTVGHGVDAGLAYMQYTLPTPGNAHGRLPGMPTGARRAPRGGYHGEQLFVATCHYPGCGRVMYSRREGKASDNLYQRHQKLKHPDWVRNKSPEQRGSVEPYSP